MRTPAISQNPLATPLNKILGTESSVRVLRVIMTSNAPQSVRDLARDARLTVAATSRTCEHLEDSGVLERPARARTAIYQLRQRWRLGPELRSLFDAERVHEATVRAAVRKALLEPDDRVQSVWLEPVEQEPDESQTVDLIAAVLSDPENVDALREQIWSGLLEVQRQLDVAITLRVTTRADILSASPERQAVLVGCVPLKGWGPAAILTRVDQADTVAQSPMRRTHAHVEADQLRLANAVAHALKRDPTLIERAKTYLASRILAVSTSEALTLKEWSDILDGYSAARIRRLLVARDERATRLRQSMPFLPILDPRERADLIAHVRDE